MAGPQQPDPARCQRHRTTDRQRESWTSAVGNPTHEGGADRKRPPKRNEPERHHPPAHLRSTRYLQEVSTGRNEPEGQHPDDHAHPIGQDQHWGCSQHEHRHAEEHPEPPQPMQIRVGSAGGQKAADAATDPETSEQERKSSRPCRKRPCGQGRQRDDEVEAEDPHDCEQAERDLQVVRCPDISETGSDLSVLTWDASYRVHLGAPDRREVGQGDHVGTGVQEEARAEPHRGEEDARDDRTNDSSNAERRQGEANGFRKEILADQFTQDALPSWLIDEIREAKHEGQKIDLPQVHRVSHHQDRQDHCQESTECVGGEQQPPSIEAVGENTPPRTEQQHGQILEGHNETEGREVMRQLDHQPSLRDVLHRTSDDGHPLGDEKEPVVANPERLNHD